MIHGDHLCNATVSMPSYDAVMVAGERCRGISGQISTVMEHRGIDIGPRRLRGMLCRNRRSLEISSMNHKKTLLAAGLLCATLGLQGLARANPPPLPVHRLTWTLSQTSPQGWTEGQPVSVRVGFGLSDPHQLWVRDSRPVPDDEPLAPATVTGWTKPIGLRVAVRW
jgi:hypothetical protein